MHSSLLSVSIVFILLSTIACNESGTKQQATALVQKEGSFGYDINFLQKHDSIIVLKDGESEIIVSPKYQGKVFTSTAAGASGKSFGWINYKAFTAPLDPHMNAYGGENRLWLGPEGGPFSLFFPKGAEMSFTNWKTPSPIDTERWEVVAKNERSVSLKKDMALVNYAGTELKLFVDRKVSILSKEAIQQQVGIALDTSLAVVGYATANSITNKGLNEWSKETGAPCIWMLDMFNPSSRTVIVIPFLNHSDTGKIATTDYFGEIPNDRVKYHNNVLLFKADGKHRGKLGLGPQRAKPIAGSWDAENGVLTVTFFDVDKNGNYLNQEWTTTKPPFSGDAVNAYNDGPLEDGKQMGPFYEIESVSPATFLKPGTSLTHNHTVLHFIGSRHSLDAVAKKLLEISLKEIETAFQ